MEIKTPDNLKRIRLLFFLLGFVLVSCQHHQVVKIGFLLPNFTDARYPRDSSFFAEKIKQLGGNVEVENAKNDPSIQEKQAVKMLNNGVKVLVIAAVNQQLAANIVRLAHEKGVKVIGYARLIDHCKLDYFITFDHYKVGQQQATYAIQKKPSGNYILIEGDKFDSNALLIHEGQHQVIDPYVNSNKIHVLYDGYIENWDPQNACHTVSRILNLSMKRIDVVLCANDGMAKGVIKALNKYQPGYPAIITGLDANLDACRRIVKGEQSMTIYKSFKQEAQIAAELAMKIARNQKITNADSRTNNGMRNVPTFLLNSVPVDSTNMKSTIIADGLYSEGSVYN